MQNKNSTAPLDATNNHDRRFMSDEERGELLAEQAKRINARINALAETQGSASTPGETDARRSADRIDRIDYDEPHRPVQHKSLYAIIDNVTGQIAGGIQLHLNDQSAVRTLVDVACEANTSVNKHPLDFDLWRLGHLTEYNRIMPEMIKITSGAQIETIIDTHQKRLAAKKQS